MTAGNKQRQALASLLYGYMELLFYLPVLLIIGIFLLPESVIWPWLLTLPLCYMSGAMLIERLPKLRLINRVLASLLLGLLQVFLISFLWTGEIMVIPIAVCGIVGAFALLRGISTSVHGWALAFPNSRMLIGVTTYIAVQPLKVSLIPKLMNDNVIVIACGIAAVILFFFLANERHLNSETVDTAKSPAASAFKRQNRFLILIIIAVISILALFTKIQRFIEDSIKSIIDRILNWLNRPQEIIETPDTPAPEAPPIMPQEEAKDPAAWLVILEQILKIAAIVIFIIAALVLLYWFGKKLYQWVRTIANKLLERNAENRRSDEGFTDEVEQLMTLNNLWDGIGNGLKNLLPKKKRGTDWNDLTTNAERIRFLYAQLLRNDAKKGYEIKEYLTPRETTTDIVKWGKGNKSSELLHGFTELYEQVRYGEGKPIDRQVAEFKTQLDNEKK